MLTDPIPHLVRAITLPASIGYFFNTMFNVVDTWFAGRISTDALAALGLSFPVFFVVIAVASGLATGISSLLANTIGSGQPEEANRLATQSITFTTIASLFITVIGILLADDAFRWMGAAPEPARLATQYMVVIFAGSLFFNIVHVLNAFLVARGDTHSYRNVLIIGLLLNIALDPWFIYGGWGLPAMGFIGVAYSTVLIQALSCIYLHRRVHQRSAMVPFSRSSLRLPRHVAADITMQSGPAMLNMMTIGIGILVITYFVNEHGSAAVAAYGIATRIEQIILLPAIGLNMAVLAIAGQNNGAGQIDRVRETVRVALRFGLYVLIPGFFLMIIWPHAAMSFFTRDAEVIEIGSAYLRIAGLLIYAYVLLFTLTAALQAIKRPMYAIWIGIYRQMIAPVIIIYILSRYTNLGVWSVWISVAFTTWSAALITIWYTRRVMNKICSRHEVGST
jgi:putative MATE family efflux protein